jgi:uncharacterized protein (DUF2344 family)
MQRRPSVILAAFLLAAHGIASAVLVTVALPLTVKVILSATVLLSAWQHWRGALLRDRRSVTDFELHSDGRVMVLQSGQWVEAKIAADSYVTRWLVAAEDHRKLRVCLRYRLRG